MALRPLPAALLVPILAGLAGCLGGGDGSPADAAAAPSDPPAQEEAPTWAVGDWWRYRSEQVPEHTLVVASETGGDWVVGTDSPDVAFFDARFDISYLGPQRKADLAGSQGSQRVRFFDFPLEDGKSWTTTWDGQEVDVTARLGPDGTYRMEARNATGAYATYVYDPEARWVSLWQFHGPDGVVQFEVRLAASGRGYAGDVASWTLQTVHEAAGDLAATPFEGATYAVPASATDVYVEFTISCSAGVAGLGTGPFPFVDDPDGRGAGSDPAPCPLEEAFAGSAGAPAAPATGGDETWGYEVNGGPGATGSYSFLILLRTLTLAPLP